jgi:hypothetical protein
MNSRLWNRACADLVRRGQGRNQPPAHGRRCRQRSHETAETGRMRTFSRVSPRKSRFQGVLR